MSRRKIREHIFKLLFQMDFYDETELEEQLNLAIKEVEALLRPQAAPAEQEDGAEKKEEKALAEIEEKLRDICRHLPEIDALIDEKATGWKTQRMAKVDLSLIRLAVYEIRFDENVPSSVAINEAVELAKRYGSDSSGAFVNGILAKMA